MFYVKMYRALTNVASAAFSNSQREVDSKGDQFRGDQTPNNAILDVLG